MTKEKQQTETKTERLSQNSFDSESDGESDDEDKEEKDDNYRTIKEMLKITPGFLSNQNGIFGDSKDNDRTLKTRKTGRSLFSRVNRYIHKQY